MKSYTMYICLFLVACSTKGQVSSGTPEENQIPEKLQNIRRAIEVQNFPKKNDPVKIKDTYYWKHATSILCKESDITITEYGAYLFYNDSWNLRKSYPLKELNKNFGTKKYVLKHSEPYTWEKNYRTDKQLFGGWALWYFIGTTASGETVCGYSTIHTTTNLLN